MMPTGELSKHRHRETFGERMRSSASGFTTDSPSTRKRGKNRNRRPRGRWQSGSYLIPKQGQTASLPPLPKRYKGGTIKARAKVNRELASLTEYIWLQLEKWVEL
jgi:hypothetical protein